jgi:hypothetical protein
MRHPIIVMMSLVSALVFSQAPEFMQQYFQRLGGVVEELDRIVGHFDEDSHRSGYERSAALGLMARNPEQLIRDQATRMEENVARLKRLHEQQDAFRNLGSFGRFGAFVMDFDGPLAQRTWDSYMPAVPVTMLDFSSPIFF